MESLLVGVSEDEVVPAESLELRLVKDGADLKTGKTARQGWQSDLFLHTSPLHFTGNVSFDIQILHHHNISIHLFTPHGMNVVVHFVFN